MQKNFYKIKQYFFIFLVFMSGITNDVLSIRFIKKLSFIEIILIFMSVYYIFLITKLKITKLHILLFLLAFIFLLSSFYTSGYLPSDTYIKVRGLFTNYSTRSLMSSLQFFYLIFISIVFATYLYRTNLSRYQIEKLIVYAVSIYSFFGLVFYFMNNIGIEIPIIQSNELSYSKYRLFSFGLEPQYTALFIVPAIFISYFNKWWFGFIINFVAIVLTFSTSVLLGVIFAFFIYSIKDVRLVYKIILIPIVIIIIYLFYGLMEGKLLSFYSVLVGENNGDSSARALSIITGLDILKEHWIEGIGWGNFSFYFLWRDEERVYNLGNIFLRLWTEGGIISLITLLIIMTYLYKKIKILPKSYFLIIISYFIYFMANSTMFLMPFFWIYMIIFEYLSKKERYVKRG